MSKPTQAAAVKLIEFETGKAPATVEIKGPVPGAVQITPESTMHMLKSNPELAERIMSELVNAAKRIPSP